VKEFSVHTEKAVEGDHTTKPTLDSLLYALIPEEITSSNFFVPSTPYLLHIIQWGIFHCLISKRKSTRPTERHHRYSTAAQLIPCMCNYWKNIRKHISRWLWVCLKLMAVAVKYKNNLLRKWSVSFTLHFWLRCTKPYIICCYYLLFGNIKNVFKNTIFFSYGVDYI
jgi:hypothetical protein